MTQAQRMVAIARNLILLALGLVLAHGCALAPQKPVVKAPLTQEQAEWWNANKHRKRWVDGKGYYVEGTSGFFDHDGHRVTSELGGSVSEEPPGIIERIAPKKVFADMKKAVGKGPNEQIARAAMEEGDSLFRQKKFVEAAKSYRIAYKRWPDSPLEEEAIFKAGESEFFADRYPKADDEYALLVKKFQSSQYLSQVTIRRFAIGRYWCDYDRAHPTFVLNPNLFDKTRTRFDTGGHALRLYEKIRLDDPVSPLADDAVMDTANTYFIKGRWDDADYHYGLLRTEYPKSEHQLQAHLLGLRCKLLRYQGPGYEGGPLDEAEDLATQLLTQFSHELGDERERVAQVRADVRSQRALREWDTAEYYARLEYYGAAKHYYAKLIKNYPETKLAQESLAKIETYKTLPDNPEVPFQWVADLLPASKKEGPVIDKSLKNLAKAPASTEKVASSDDAIPVRK
jgi:outer membrane protein assembly factor BamD (BamD/ComL family)